MTGPLEDLEAQHAFAGFAQIAGVLRRQFMEEGFTRKEAVQLVGVWLAQTISGASSSEE